MSEHTQGKWAISENYPEYVVEIDGGWSVVHGCHSQGKETNEANAARIVACVNHFEGVNTKTIETLNPVRYSADPKSTQVIDCAKRLIVAEERLDKALAALQHIDDSLEGWIKGCSIRMKCAIEPAEISDIVTDKVCYESLRTHTQAALDAGKE